VTRMDPTLAFLISLAAGVVVFLILRWRSRGHRIGGPWRSRRSVELTPDQVAALLNEEFSIRHLRGAVIRDVYMKRALARGHAFAKHRGRYRLAAADVEAVRRELQRDWVGRRSDSDAELISAIGAGLAAGAYVRDYLSEFPRPNEAAGGEPQLAPSPTIQLVTRTRFSERTTIEQILDQSMGVLAAVRIGFAGDIVERYYNAHSISIIVCDDVELHAARFADRFDGRHFRRQASLETMESRTVTIRQTPDSYPISIIVIDRTALISRSGARRDVHVIELLIRELLHVEGDQRRIDGPSPLDIPKPGEVSEQICREFYRLEMRLRDTTRTEEERIEPISAAVLRLREREGYDACMRVLNQRLIAQHEFALKELRRALESPMLDTARKNIEVKIYGHESEIRDRQKLSPDLGR
jgi:hypothetical protein